MKRFFSDVSTAPVDGGHSVLLDGKPIRTPARALLCVPRRALADAIAEEWRQQGERIDPRTMPLTGLANAVIDRIAPRMPEVVADLSIYGETDLVCYRADGPTALITRQAAVWDPLIAWVRQRYDVQLAVTTGVMHMPQPPAVSSALARAVAALDPWQLAAAHQFVTLTGSLVIALALIEGQLDADTAFAAGELDALFQAEYWGEDAEAIEARESRKATLEGAARFLELLG